MFISYAQNFEDVMLWRAFFDITRGSYIDVGAQHPEIDSVSKAFYMRGWRGAHVEPLPEYAELLRKDRPDEQVFQAALGTTSGLETIYAIPNTGLSTTQAIVAERHKLESGFESNSIVVPRVTLDDVFKSIQQTDIHWLKIDVEGSERAVLEGWKNLSFRPWVIVIEATSPGSQVENHDLWEALIVERDYWCVYRDGLNRFYLADEHLILKDRFTYPPNVFDDACFSGLASAPWTRLVTSNYEQRLESQRELLEKRAFEAEQKAASVITDLRLDLSELDQEVISLRQSLVKRDREMTYELTAANKRLEELQLNSELQEQRWAVRVNDAKAGVDQLQLRLTEVTTQLHQIQSSRSWRITYPLRKSARFVRRLLGLGTPEGERLPMPTVSDTQPVPQSKQNQFWIDVEPQKLAQWKMLLQEKIGDNQ
jgi:FkbM family methyltransferase